MELTMADGSVLSVNKQTGEASINDRGQVEPFKYLGQTSNGEVIVSRKADGVPFYVRAGRAIKVTGGTAGYAIPKHLSGTSVRTAVPHSVPASQLRFPWTQRGQLRAIAPEHVPGPQGWVLKDEPVPAPPENNIVPWALTGQGMVPQAVNTPVVLIEDRVPSGFRLRMTYYILTLGPSVLLEDNLIWRIQAGDVDLLNPFSAVTRTGRPNRSNLPTPFSPSIQDLPVFGPGTPLKVSVSCVNPIASADVIGASIFGSLWGDK